MFHIWNGCNTSSCRKNRNWFRINNCDEFDTAILIVFHFGRSSRSFCIDIVRLFYFIFPHNAGPSWIQFYQIHPVPDLEIVCLFLRLAKQRKEGGRSPLFLSFVLHALEEDKRFLSPAVDTPVSQDNKTNFLSKYRIGVYYKEKYRSEIFFLSFDLMNCLELIWP